MEDVAARQPDLPLQLGRRPGLDAGPAVGVRRQAVGDRLRQHRVQLRQARRQRALLGRGVRRRVAEQPGGHVQSEQGQRLEPLPNGLRAQDRRVRQSVTVDLGRRRRGQSAGLRLGVRGLQLPVALGDVEGAREGLARVRGGVPQARQAAQHHVDLQLGALRCGPRVLAEQPGQRRRCGVHQHPAGHRRRLAVPVSERHLGVAAAVAVGVGGDRGDLAVGPDPRAGRQRRLGQRARDRAHPADRDVPVARAVADHVVQEAAVLPERGVVGVGEGADQRVREDDAAHQVVREGPLDRLAEWPLEQGRPGVVVRHAATQLGAVGQRLGERREHPSGELPGHLVEALPGLPLAVGAGQRPERLPGTARVARVHQQAGRLPVAHGRGVRGDPAPPQVQPQPEVPHHLPRQQADQVGVARQPGVHTRERPGGDGRPADPGQPFQDQHPLPGPRQIGRRHQPVVPAADDHDVVPRGRVRVHPATLRQFARTRNGRAGADGQILRRAPSARRSASVG